MACEFCASLGTYASVRLYILISVVVHPVYYFLLFNQVLIVDIYWASLRQNFSGRRISNGSILKVCYITIYLDLNFAHSFPDLGLSDKL